MNQNQNEPDAQDNPLDQPPLADQFESTLQLPGEFFSDNAEGSTDEIHTFDTQPDLKQLTKYGVFLWWSDQIPTWVHPEDVETAKRLVPGCKIFRREPCEDELDRTAGYSRLVYGSESFRAQPIVWLEVASEGFEIGDRVEIKSGYGKRRPGIATLREMVWNRHQKRIEYFLESIGMPKEKSFTVEEIQPAVKLGDYLTEREIKLAGRVR